MAKWLAAVGLVALSLPMIGCNGQAGPAAVTQCIVSGTVNLDGAAIPEGEITFTSPGMGGAAIPIKDGKFEGQAAVGEKRVEIRAYRDGEPVMMDGKPGPAVRENYIPGRFNTESTLTAKVGATGAKDLKFDVESK
ncbi:MAG TPA: hypothetical protein PLR25_08820 [Planctomycetaceae bacterium]|nr:hypothetical protein [Planctomycetaceae bacterium]